MPGLPYHISVESVRWREALPSLHLFDTFRLAVHPAKLLLAFVLVLLLYLGGIGLDAVWAGEPFHDAAAIMQRQFYIATEAALHLDLGLSITAPLERGGVLGSVVAMAALPFGFLWRNHWLFLLIYLVYAFGVVALFGGAIARLAAIHACRELRQSPTAALRFAGSQFLWFVLAPLLPLGMAGLLALLLGAAGVVLFNLPGLDVVGGLLYGPLLALGAALALALLGFFVGVHLLYPAIAIEGADAFDAISRAYNYVLGRLGRFMLYLVVGLVFFALTYLLVSLLVYATLWLTDSLLRWGSFAGTGRTVERFREVLASAEGRIDADGTTGAAGWLVALWRRLILLLLPTYVISFYFSLCTWVYLLLRRSADQVSFDELYLPAAVSVPVTPAVEPEPAVQASAPSAINDDAATSATP